MECSKIDISVIVSENQARLIHGRSGFEVLWVLALSVDIFAWDQDAIRSILERPRHAD